MLVQIPVGTKDKNGELLEPERRERVARAVATTAGGLTRWGTRGLWINSAGEMVGEAGEIWMIELEDQDQLTFIQNLIKIDLCQEEVISWPISLME